MCLILFNVIKHPHYKLILGANRDEFFNRRTASVDYWDDYPFIVGGRDLEAQGTWMAMTQRGRLAMVTNFRDPQHIDPNAPSRGKLVSDYLIDDSISALDYLKAIEPNAARYNGFNLIVGDADQLFYLSNYAPGIQQIPTGLHGLSNALLDTPWPKVVLGKRKFNGIIQSNKIDTEELLDALYDDQRAADDQLPSTGLSPEREKSLSSMFIKTEGYGTRCSTVILVSKENHVTYVERQYDLHTYASTAKKFEFDLLR